MNKNIKGSFLKIATIFLTLNLVLDSFYPLFFSPGSVYAQEEGTYWYCDGDSIMEVPPGGYPVELENCANSSRKCRIISTPGYSQYAECYSEPTPNLLDVGAVTTDQGSADITQELLITPSNIYPPLVENEEGMISACTEELVNPGYDVRCDPNYHKKLIIEQWRNTSCQLVERPGILTEENCGDFQVGTACTRQLLDAYAAKECDPAYGKLVWMEKWQDGNCEPFTKPGALTKEYCEGALPKLIGACEVVLLNPRIGQECDPAYGQYAAIELWRDANCRVTEKVGPLIPGSSCGTGSGSLTTLLEEQQFSQTREGSGGIVAQADTALENIDQGRYGLGYYKAVANNEEQAEELAKKAAEAEKTAKAEEDYYTQLLKQQEKVWEETDWEKYWAEDARAKSALKIVESLGGKVESTPAGWTFVLPESCMIDPSMCAAAEKSLADNSDKVTLTDIGVFLGDLIVNDRLSFGQKAKNLLDDAKKAGDWCQIAGIEDRSTVSDEEKAKSASRWGAFSLAGGGNFSLGAWVSLKESAQRELDNDLKKYSDKQLTEEQRQAREECVEASRELDEKEGKLIMDAATIGLMEVVTGPAGELAVNKVGKSLGRKAAESSKSFIDSLGEIFSPVWNDGKNFAGDLWRNSGDRFFSRGSKDTAEGSVEQVAQVLVKALDEGKPVWVGVPEKLKGKSGGEVKEVQLGAKKSAPSFGHPDRNEDAVICNPQTGFCAVFDGMGGEAAGDRASSLTKNAFEQKMGLLSPDASVQEVIDAMGQAEIAAKKAMSRDISLNPKQSGMGTTASMVRVVNEGPTGKIAIIGQAGDSRAYLVKKDGSILQLTKDQNDIPEHLKAKFDQVTSKSQLSTSGFPSELDYFINRNVVKNPLQADKGALKIDLYQLNPNADAYILTVSDGITDNLTYSQMQAIARKNSSNPQALVDGLVETSQSVARQNSFRSKPDDMSAAVIDVSGSLSQPSVSSRLDPNSGKWVPAHAAQPKEVPRPELERLNRGTLNIGRPRSFNIQTLFDKVLGLIFGSKVLAQEDTIATASSTSSAGTSPVDRLMTQDEFRLIEAMTSVKHKLAEDGKISSEEVKKALQKNSQIKGEGIKTEDQMILTTGGSGQVEFEAEKGNYFVDSLALEEVDIIIPSVVTLNKDTEVLAVGINKGQGEIKKLGGIENKVSGSSGISKVKIITFYDKNSNGKLDGDEKAVPWAGVVVILTKVYQNQEISLNAGWNLVTLTALPQSTLTASSLISEIEKQGGEVSTVSSLEDGGWKSYVKRGEKFYSNPGDNFVIEPGKAYFIKALKPLIFKFSGQNFSEPIKVKLSTGWNALGLPKTSQSYQASELLDKSKGEQVSKWESGLWNTLVKKETLEYGDNFRIFNNRGYILRVEKEGELSP